MLWSYLSIFSALCCFVGQSVGVIMVSGDTTAPLNCEYPCQTTPPSSSRPLYGTPPPPPSEPVYEAPPPPSPTEPVYEAPPSPVGPPCQPPPPPPAAPLYGMPPPPGNCQPPRQNCVYTDVYQSIDSASDVPLYWLHILALLSLFFLPWLIC